MDKSLRGVRGAVAAAGIGLALSTGHGLALADPSVPDGATSPHTDVSAPAAQRDSERAKSTETTERGGDDATATHVRAGKDSSGDEVDDTADDTAPPPTATSTEDPTVGSDDEPSAPVRSRNAGHHRAVAVSGSKSVKRDVATPTADAPAAAEQADLRHKPATASDTEDRATTPSATRSLPAATVSTALASPPPAPAPVEQVTTKPVTVLAKFLSRLRADSGSAPAESPMLWVMLAWARRQSAPAESTSNSGQGSTTSLTTAPRTVNVRDYGAVGDGVTDDSAALKAAQAALSSGDTLYLPDGDYRFAQQNPSGSAAILLRGLSNVTVEFAPGARLLMDNLDASGHGTSHGIRVEGAASNVTLLNPDIVWVTRPSARSFGDGISVLGWPSDSPPPSGWSGSTGTVQNVSVINGRVENAPQAGAVFMGCSDVTVTDFTAVGTLADGLHFNANRRVTVDGLTAIDTGDDGLAFVTYYDPTQPWTYGPTDGPFNQAGLGEWNNGGSVASHITVTGGRANGFRVQGGYDITITDVTVTDKEFGFHVNSAIATGPGDWTSIASQNIDISDVTISGAQTGIVLATNNIDGTEDSKWWDFSGVTISDVTILGSKNWSLAVETPATTTSKFSGVTLRNIHAESHSTDGPFGGGNGGILLASLQNSVIDNVRLVADHPADIYLFGAGQLRSGLSVDQLPSSNLTVNDLVLQGPGRILIQDIAGVQFGDIGSYGADGAAVMLYRVKDASFHTITAYLPGRGTGDGYGVRLLQVADIEIEDIEVTMDDHLGSSWWTVELSGGNPTEFVAGTGVHIANVTYVSGRNATTPDIGIQGGPYGPVDWYISGHWLHQGEATPQWRSWLYGDTSPV